MSRDLLTPSKDCPGNLTVCQRSPRSSAGQEWISRDVM